MPISLMLNAVRSGRFVERSGTKRSDWRYWLAMLNLLQSTKDFGVFPLFMTLTQNQMNSLPD
ncbi:hypothetical protein SAMN04487869_1027 [Marinobacter sp. DSM 26671]|nr:hypothetical protein SAMN04487869_1027 [Marinobacter sp. DSM 26671]